jgi:hypothetical protein
MFGLSAAQAAGGLVTLLWGLLCYAPAAAAAASATFDPSAVTAYVNSYRALHGAPKAVYSSEVADAAQAWAARLASSGTLAHSTPAGAYGENLGFTSPLGGGSASAAWHRIIDLWYGEGVRYDYSAPGSALASVGHFTQLVWVASDSIGMGLALDDKDNAYVVMRFKPAGNVLGRFDANVLALRTPFSPSPPLPLPLPHPSYPLLLPSPSPSPQQQPQQQKQQPPSQSPRSPLFREVYAPPRPLALFREVHAPPPRPLALFREVYAPPPRPLALFRERGA